MATAPVPVPTTDFPPPPFGFGAPPYSSYPAPPLGFVSAPAYAPTTYPAPPFGFGAPPYAPYHHPYPYFPSPYPYPPPGFFPAPVYGPYTFPSAATSDLPVPESTTSPTSPVVGESLGSTPTSAHRRVAPSPSPGLDPVRVSQPLSADTATIAPSFLTPPLESTAPTNRVPPSSPTPTRALKLRRRPDQVPGIPLSTASQAVRASPARESSSRMQPDHTSAVLDDHALLPKPQDSMTVTSQRHATTALGRPSLDCFHAKVIDRTTEVIKEGLSRSSSASSMSATPTPLSGSLSGSTTTWAPCPRVFSAPSVSPSAPTVSAATKVFGEMPTPICEKETQGTASEHQNLTRNPCVINLSEQNPDGRPQRYGLQNLCVQSIILSDGTELSYFALPTDYPLKQAIPSTSPSAAEQVGVMAPRFVPAQAAVSLAPVCCSETNNAACSEETKGCSHEFIRVFTATPEQPTKEVEQRQSHQAPMFFSDATFSPERPVVGTVGVFSLTSDKSTCDLEKLNESDNLFLAKQDTEQPLKFSSDEEFQGNEQLFGEISVFQSAEGHSISFFLWDPGSPELPILFPTAAGDTELNAPTLLVLVIPCTTGTHCSLPSSANRTKLQWHPGIQVVNDRDTSHSTWIIRDAEWLQNTEDCFTQQELLANSSSKVAAFTWHGSLPRPLFILPSGTTCTWDPGILCIRDRRQDKYTISPQVQFVQLVTELPVLSLIACIQNMATSGSNSVLQIAPFNLQMDAHLSQGILMLRVNCPHICACYRITNLTSTTFNVIRSSAYGYIMDFLIGQGESTDQQEVHEYYKTKHFLLSSKKYYQTCELDIIFITFLPP